MPVGPVVFAILFSLATSVILQEVCGSKALHMPIYKTETSTPRTRRRVLGLRRDAEIGLGDFLDVTYSVLVSVGDTTTPLVLDTGSSDLWILSDSCTSPTCNQTTIPLYPQRNFHSVNLDAQLYYGDSRTGTHAFGTIGQDVVDVAGLRVLDQHFAAINDTNTSVLETGAAGIFGLGFPLNSVLWFELFKRDHPTLEKQTTTPKSQSQSQGQGSPWTPMITSSFFTSGPFLVRLLASRDFSPRFTITLQRDTVAIGGNAGMLSIGSLPSGVREDSLTWVNVRTYEPSEGGIRGPPDSPHEKYPLAWEIFIEEVYFDGEKLPRSSSDGERYGVSALIDTGSSLIRGPLDLISLINAMLSSSSPSSPNSPPTSSRKTFACSTPSPPTLTFRIGGKLFPVDPRDLVAQAWEDDVEECVLNLAGTDPPRLSQDGEAGADYKAGKGGRRKGYSWTLGAPFLKSVLTTFHMGDLAYPSRDPPRVGLLSTVEIDKVKVKEEYEEAVEWAEDRNGGNFAETSEAAPPAASTPASPSSPTRTNIDGVRQAGHTSSPPSSLSSSPPSPTVTDADDTGANADGESGGNSKSQGVAQGPDENAGIHRPVPIPIPIVEVLPGPIERPMGALALGSLV